MVGLPYRHALQSDALRRGCGLFLPVRIDYLAFRRIDDVLQPVPEYVDRAFGAVLPFYNLKRGGDVPGAIRMVRAQIMNLLVNDWSKLAALMESGASSVDMPKQIG